MRIKYPLVIVSGIAAFLTLGSFHETFDAFGWHGKYMEVFLEMLALSIVVLSTLNAASNMEQRAEKHRTAGNKYIAIRRDARQIKIEMENCPNEPEAPEVFIERLTSPKDMLNNIAQDAPQVPPWAHEYAMTMIGPDKL